MEHELIATLYRAFNENDPDLVDRVLSRDWEDIPLVPGQPHGPDGMKHIIRMFGEAFPGARFTIDDMVGSEGRIGVRARVTGLHKGPFLGIPATGNAIDFRLYEFHEFEEGRIRRTWHMEDWMTLFGQLGTFPPVG